MRVLIYPYKLGSASAKAIKRAFNTICISPNGRYRRKLNDIIINWGSTTLPTWGRVDLNQPEAVASSVNKSTALQVMREAGVRTVEFTTDPDMAGEWLDDGSTVYARTLTRASAGRGIHVVNPGEQLPNAPLYTKGIDSNLEYRVHVFRGLVIDYTKKVPLRELSANGSLIKSHDNGWTFARNVERRPSIETLAVEAIVALGLDFGAVDIIINPEDKNRPYVLEVNTSPGQADGSRTLESYVTAIRNYVEDRTRNER